MNIKLVELLAQFIQTLSPEERSLLEEKLKAQQEQTSAEGKERPFYETATPAERVKAFREWVQSHRGDRSSLSDKAISRESMRPLAKFFKAPLLKGGWGDQSFFLQEVYLWRKGLRSFFIDEFMIDSV